MAGEVCRHNRIARRAKRAERRATSHTYRANSQGDRAARLRRVLSGLESGA
jgi:hypothetical protein